MGSDWFKKHYWSFFFLIVTALTLIWMITTASNMNEVKASMTWEGLTIIGSKDNLMHDGALDPLPEWNQSDISQQGLTPLYLLEQYNYSDAGMYSHLDEAVARHDCAAYKNIYTYMNKGFLFFIMFPYLILLVILIGICGSIILKRRST
jgi:hypothetical protein